MKYAKFGNYTIVQMILELPKSHVEVGVVLFFMTSNGEFHVVGGFRTSWVDDSGDRGKKTQL